MEIVQGISAYTMDQSTRNSTQGQSAPVTDDIVKLEPPWSMKEEPPDQPSAVYSTVQPVSDNTCGSLLSQNRSHVCQRCSAVFMLSRSLKVHLEIFHGETLHSELPVAPRLHGSANEHIDKKLEPLWSVKEEPQDQPSAVYSTQPMSDNSSGSLLSLDTSHVCQHCCSSFVLFSSLELHMVAFHGETLQDWFPMYSAYKCDDVGNQRDSVTGNTGDNNLKALKGKREKVDDKDTDRTDPQNKSTKHVCDVCDRAFGRASHLKRHALIHTRPKSFVCDVCSKAFIAASHLKSHKLTHAYPKSSSCDVCGKTFTNPKCLKSHKLIHAVYKPFVCDVCSKAFPQAGQLRKHELLHASHKPFVCDVCNKAFIGVSQLKVHKFIHTDHKPFVCDVCSKGFTQSCHLKKHKVIHTRSKLVACGVCNKTFLTASDLNDHKWTHTGHKPFFM